VTKPEEIKPALVQAQALMRRHRVPVVVEVILERVTNISMGTEIDHITGFEALAKQALADAKPLHLYKAAEVVALSPLDLPGGSNGERVSA
jgi:glyoxylate carboligase